LADVKNERSLFSQSLIENDAPFLGDKAGNDDDEAAIDLSVGET
jgi:hypothetical protein